MCNLTIIASSLIEWSQAFFLNYWALSSFACSNLPRDSKREIRQSLLGQVAEADIFEFNLSGGYGELWSVGSITNASAVLQQLKHVLHVDEARLEQPVGKKDEQGYSFRRCSLTTRVFSRCDKKQGTHEHMPSFNVSRWPMRNLWPVFGSWDKWPV